MYKKILFIAIATFASIQLSYGQKTAPKIVFDTLIHNFGTIKSKSSKTYDFEYHNSGELPLVILSTRATCSCTRVKFNKKPLLPGQTAQVSVTYNAKDPGTFLKEIAITTNSTPPITYLIIKGRVEN